MMLVVDIVLIAAFALFGAYTVWLALTGGFSD